MRGRPEARVLGSQRVLGSDPAGPRSPSRSVGLLHRWPTGSSRPVLSTGLARVGFLLTAIWRDRKAQLSPPCPQVTTRGQEGSSLSERQQSCVRGPAARP